MLSIVLIFTGCRGDEDPSDSKPPGDGTVDTPPPDQDDDDGDCHPDGDVVINELEPSNVTVLVDAAGESVDWVELYNEDTEPVDLAGWTLTDDGDFPEMWTFPAVTLDPAAFLVVYASGKGPATPVASWDTRVDVRHDWRYLEVLSAPDPGWYLPGYDDGSWDTGPSGFGREDADDETEVPAAQTVYVRTEVQLTAAERTDVTALYLHMDYDDGFVAYLNGVEVARDNIGVSGLPPAWDEFAKKDHEARIPDGLGPTQFDLRSSLALLTEGTNTLAVEVHNLSTTSLDLSLIPFLTFGFGTERGGSPSAEIDFDAITLHTNFSLGADGERVRLYDPKGCEADDVEPGPMLGDQSYGRQPDGDKNEGYFLEPTPGESNVTESRPGFATTPSFDPAPGYYPGGTEVSVIAESTSVVHFAWAGAEPTESDPVFAGPESTGNFAEAMVLRARAWEDGLWPSRTATATYLLHEPGTLPIVSVVTDPPNLWDEETGIYVFGAPGTFDAESPYYGANFWEEWERPVHIEEWEPDGILGFAVDAGISTYGGFSRAHEQKSLLVQLRSGYGDESIPHEIFPGLGLVSFDRLLLRAGGTDWHGCFIDGCSEGANLRDALTRQLTADENVDAMAYRPAEVYLNGEYWGIYELRERPDDEFVADHYGAEDIDLLELDGAVIHGDGVQYQSTLTWLRTHDLANSANYAQARTMIDVDSFMTYLIFEIYYDNKDWPGNNFKFWRPRTAEGRWRWFLYDTDNGFGRRFGLPSHDQLALTMQPDGPGWPNPPWSTELFRLLLQSPEFTDAFVNRYAELLNTTFTPQTSRAMLHDLEEGVAAEMPRHVERWGEWTDGVTTWTMAPNAWEDEIAWVDEWLGERPAEARAHVVTDFALAGTWTLDLDVQPTEAGTFQIGTIEVDGPSTGIWFQGVPVTVTAVPAAGYAFVDWSDGSTDPTLTLDPGAPTSLVARFE